MALKNPDNYILYGNVIPLLLGGLGPPCDELEFEWEGPSRRGFNKVQAIYMQMCLWP